MFPLIDVDVETRSKADLLKVGAWKYSKHETTDVWCVCWWHDGMANDSVEVWTPGNPVPDVFRGPYTLAAHNYQFERSIFLNILVPRYGFAEPFDYRCSMAAALRFNLPPSLENVAKSLKLENRKDKGGHALMRKMANASRYDPATPAPKSLTPETHAENLDRLIAYCKMDVLVERDASFAISDRFGAVDKAMFELDAKINNRGVLIDVQTARAVDREVKKEVKRLHEKAPEITDGAVAKASQLKPMLEWLKVQGFNADDLQAETVESWQLHSPNLTEPGQRLLELRRKTSLGSVAKFSVMATAVDDDNRLRGLYQLYGASQTGRWGGRLVQPQNLPRMSITDDEVEMLVTAYREGDSDTIRMLYGDCIAPAKQLIRPMFTSDEGLIVSDLAQIECRTLAWLAGCDSLLNLFASSDRDPYSEMAAKIYSKPASEFGKGTDGRQLGKVVILGCGYGMGANAFKATFGSGFNLSDDMANSIIRTYRDEFPEICRFWYQLEDAFRTVMSSNLFNRRQVGRITVMKEGDAIVVTLPSGRTLYYHDARVNSDNRLMFHAATGLKETYSGKIAENVTQAVARDVLAEAMLRLDAAGYAIVGHVHDEVIIETGNELDVSNVTQIMSSVPAWAKGLPLESETAFGKRYTK